MTFYPTNCLYREALFAPTILARVAAPSSPVRHGSDASARPQRRVAARQPPAPAPRLGTHALRIPSALHPELGRELRRC